MSIQDKMEQILKNIHLQFSESRPYDEDGAWIIVDKEKIFEQLEQLNLAVYEMMDTYEMTNQKHQLAQRRCEKRGEEIIRKASSHADDIYAASIMYTDDAINRICHIMEDTNDSIRKVFRGLDREMEHERERVRRNQLELTSQLQDFADTNKYIKLIEEINKKLERERMEEMQAQKEKRIQNEGKSYPSVQPDIRVNEEYLERRERHYELTPLEINVRKEEEESLARVTGKEFAESLRRRAAKSREQQQSDLQIEDMSENIPSIQQEMRFEEVTLPPEEEPLFSEESSGFSGESSGFWGEDSGFTGEGIASSGEDFAFSEESSGFSGEEPEIRVDLDAEYFKWKEENGEADDDGETAEPERRGFKSLFGRKS